MAKYPKRYPAPLPPVAVVNEVIAAESQRRLITNAWRSDLPATCEALQQRLAQHDTKRARLALALLTTRQDAWRCGWWRNGLRMMWRR